MCWLKYKPGNPSLWMKHGKSTCDQGYFYHRMRITCLRKCWCVQLQSVLVVIYHTSWILYQLCTCVLPCWHSTCGSKHVLVNNNNNLAVGVRVYGLFVHQEICDSNMVTQNICWEDHSAVRHHLLDRTNLQKAITRQSFLDKQVTLRIKTYEVFQT